MEQYIPKAAVVAEIERRLELLDNAPTADIKEFPEIMGAQYYELINLARYIDTIEVKEVDFEKIWKEYFKYRGDVATVNIKHLAKHFFELGIKAQVNKI